MKHKKTPKIVTREKEAAVDFTNAPREEDKPIINLAEVPEFPKSKAVFGSANPPKPIPLIKQFDEFDKLIEAPKLFMASTVLITSSLFNKPLILLLPIAIEDKITNLCEIDLSPGIKILPFNFLLLIDFICLIYISYYWFYCLLDLKLIINFDSKICSWQIIKKNKRCSIG